MAYTALQQCCLIPGLSPVPWAIISSGLRSMTSPHSFLWGNGPMSDSTETSSPHRIGHRTPQPQPILPPPQPPQPRQPLSTAASLLVNTESTDVVAQPTVPQERAGTHWAAYPPSEDSGLAQVSGLHWLGGKGHYLLCCHVMFTTVLSAE